MADNKTIGLLLSLLFAVGVAIGQTVLGANIDTTSMAGAIIVSALAGFLFYAKAHQSDKETLDIEKLLTTIITAVGVTLLTGTLVTDVTLNMALSGTTGTTVALIVETIGKIVARSAK